VGKDIQFDGLYAEGAPGAHISEIAHALCFAAEHLNVTIHCVMNGTHLRVTPLSKPDDVVAFYRKDYGQA
jgi:hypothetical protein